MGEILTYFQPLFFKDSGQKLLILQDFGRIKKKEKKIFSHNRKSESVMPAKYAGCWFVFVLFVFVFFILLFIYIFCFVSFCFFGDGFT